MPPRRFADPERLLAGAAELFAERGYQSTTIDDLAAYLGVAKPTIYQYVRGKAFLLEGIVAPVFERMVQSSVVAVAGWEDPEEQLQALVREHVLVVADSVTAFRIFLGEEKELPPALRRRYAGWQRQLAQTYEQVLDRCRSEGVVRDDVDPKIVAFLLLGMITGVARWYDPGGEVDPCSLTRQPLALIAGCLAARR